MRATADANLFHGRDVRVSGIRILFLVLGLTVLPASPSSTSAQQRLLDAPCTAVTSQPVTEPVTGRTYLLDYPCDLQPGEDVTLLLNLHGGGSSGSWQRRYFPAFDHKEAYRLVIASPYSPTRSWSTNDDSYLQGVVTAMIGAIGAENIESFWLVGHSQGGSTSRRLVCTPFFQDKVDGFLSLSGGRLGGAAPRSPNAGRPRQADEPEPTAAPEPTPAAAPAATPAAPPAEPNCDFSHIFAIGEHEIASLPTSSTWAAKYGCAARSQQPDVVDSVAGYVHDGGRQNPGTPAWGLLPQPGRAEVFVFPNCAAGRTVADIVRIDKGHTEGLEPRITEELVRLMTTAAGGKIARPR
jgi:pimeloyl-ACP methyl ester carboxylesterase